MSKVFVVTTGSYSSYKIRAVFSKEKLAKNFLKYLKSVMDYEANDLIEEYILDEDTPKSWKKGYFSYEVTMSKNGDVLEVIKFSDEEDCIKGHIYFYKVGHNDLARFSLFARDEKQAIKIVNEKRAQLIANNSWGINKN